MPEDAGRDLSVLQRAKIQIVIILCIGILPLSSTGLWGNSLAGKIAMKICIKCSQVVAEKINTCPICGSEMGASRGIIDGYRILEVLHEGYSSILCKARRDDEDAPVMIRIFTQQSGVDSQVAARLKHLQAYLPTRK